MICKPGITSGIILQHLNYLRIYSVVGGLGMRRISQMTMAGLLAFGVAGCGFFGGGDTAVSPSPVEPLPETAQSPEPSPSVEEPTTAASPSPTASPAATLPPGSPPSDLIPSINREQRLQDIARNRPDPFALLPTNPIVQVTEEPQPAAPTTPETGQVPNAPGAPGELTPGNLPPGGLAPIPDLVPVAPIAPIVPPPPQPELARAVEVTGVVQINNIPYAIVNAPNEPFSRYVRTGQLLSDGQVLVKRIEMYDGAEPVVVFEQYGIEVVRAVGEGGPPTTEQPTAAIPSPMSFSQATL